MTDKQTLIVDYLKHNDRQGYYIDIRDAIGNHFDNEDDFDNTLYQLVALDLVYEKDNDTLYRLRSKVF